jgi:hypothetical protein
MKSATLQSVHLSTPQVPWDRKKKIRVGCDRKFQLAIRQDFNYQMSVLKVRLSDFENVEILIFIKVCIMCDLSVVKEFPYLVQWNNEI